MAPSFIRQISLFLTGIILFSLLSNCTNNQDSKQNLTNVILNEKESYFFIDTASYPKVRNKLPIGVFDSGTGGLTVLDAIVNFDSYNNETKALLKKGDNIKDFQKEFFIYLGDQANMPYGNYSKENKVALLKEHIIKDAQFLLGQKYYINQDEINFKKDKLPVKAIVVACNTATAYGLVDIQNFIEEAGLDIKVIGVIDAGVKAALSSISKNKNVAVGIMATAGTVSSEGYVKALNKWKQELGFANSIEAFQQAGIGLAGAIDGAGEYIDPTAMEVRKEYKGPSITNTDVQIDKTILSRYDFNWKGNELLISGSENNPDEIQLNSVNNYIKYHVVTLLENIRRPKTKNKLSSIILGCTHYPFYIKEINNELERLYNLKENGKYVYRSVMNGKIDLIDPAKFTSKELYEFLVEQNLFNSNDITNSEFYISCANPLNEQNVIDRNGNFTYDYKYGREEGFIQEYVKRVPFSKKTISREIAERLNSSIPFTFSLIKSFNKNNVKLDYLKPEERLN